MKESYKVMLFFFLRFLLYAAIMVILNLIYSHDATHITDTGKFGENSWTEILQEAFLFISGVVFLITGRFDLKMRPIANLTAVFFFMCFIREFNNQIPYWSYLEIPLIVLFGILVFLDRSKLESAILRLVENRAISWLVTGFLVTFVFSRLFGKTVFWEHILENNYNRWAKNAAEEGIELLGYTLLLIGSIEILVQAFRGEKKPEQNLPD
jgi:hypothetical protein